MKESSAIKVLEDLITDGLDTTKAFEAIVLAIKALKREKVEG